MILGIDEVGRGPWAGPLVFGAVVLGGANIEGLTDSKKLTKKRREVLDATIRAEAHAFGLGWVSAEELDEIGMSAACTLACRRALEQLEVPSTEIVIDGTVNFLKETGKGPYVTTMKQADLLVPSVSAASILAKVARDTYMEAQDSVYPGYGFAAHVGYGTKQHSRALESLGVTPLHRKSFAPIAKIISGSSLVVTKNSVTETSKVTTRGIGNASETAAAKYLEEQGYTILERNWKTKLCEIDIVATKGKTVYFCEVKHRKSERQGGGLEAITSQKHRQMLFAARVFAHNHKLTDVDLRLVAIATTGVPPKVTDCIEL